ncbi:glycosyl transferase [Segatella asaccharophila]
MKKIQILVCAHKESSYTRNCKPYTAIQVGKALHPDINLGFLNDNIGDNISNKNSSWSELTALYWGWKNINDVEYLGLCHYRRYFDVQIDDTNIDKIIKEKDIIVIKSPKMNSRQERADNLIHMTSQEDYYIFADTFLSIYPQFHDSFINYFYNSRVSYPYTMFIAKKEIYDAFCNFIFPVLFKVEKRIKKHGYSRQQRCIGYFGEWSLGLFISCMHLKVKCVPLVFCDKGKNKHSKLAYFCRDIWKFFYFVLDRLKPTPKEILVPPDVMTGLKQDGIILNILK